MADALDNRATVKRVVQDHAAWVFAAARRRVKDAALAEDVTQAVFLLFWRKRPALGQDGKLAGWLYRAVRYCSANALRLHRIRQRHEREAAMARKQVTERPAGWSEVEIELEGAMDRLSEKDRQAIVLRFYRALALREVGEAMGIGEQAARKRVDRAVEKLRQRLTARGIETQSVSLSAMVLTYAAEGGPDALVGKITASIGQGLGSGMAGGIAKGAMKMMALAKLRVAVLVGVFFAAGVMIAQVASSTQTASETQEVLVSRPIVPVVDAEKDALLQDLQRVRAATRAAVVSGRGTAHLETSEERAPQLAEANPSLVTHAVQFVFRGSESLVTGGVAYNATAMLATDSQFVRYYAGLAGRPAPAAVSIYRPVYMIFSADVPNWSFQEISRLPCSLSHDDLESQLFAAMAKMPEAHVEKTGSVVVVRVERPRLPIVVRDLRVLEFDLALGGMLTHYRYETTDNRDGHKEDSMEDWQLAWSNTKGVVTPSRRVAVAEFRRDGKLTQRYGSKIGFDTFVMEDVPAEQITIGHMGVLPGTPVVDQITNREWRYGQQ